MMTSIECATATRAFFLPRRRANLWYWAARYVFLVWEAAHAACTNAVRKYGFPLFVLPVLRLPADSLFPGHSPAQLEIWLSEGNALMSTPISATTVSAVRLPTPRMVSKLWIASPRKGSWL